MVERRVARAARRAQDGVDGCILGRHVRFGRNERLRGGVLRRNRRRCLRNLDRRGVGQLERFEQFVELVVPVVCHRYSLVPCVPAPRSRGIVARMPVFTTIRVAETWTVFSVIALVLFVAGILALAFWLVARS